MGQVCTLGLLGCGRDDGYAGRIRRKPYTSDLTDAQWDVLAPLPPPDSVRGHPRTVDLREVVRGGVACPGSGSCWAGSDTQRGRYRQPVGEDHEKRGRAAMMLAKKSLGASATS